jgi:hypothetical protein
MFYTLNARTFVTMFVKLVLKIKSGFNPYMVIAR